MEQHRAFWGLLSRRPCLVPTLRGWLVLAATLAAVVITGARALGPFLTTNDPLPGGVLVIEGWAPDYAMEAAIAEFRRNHYDKLFVTGIPNTRPMPNSARRSWSSWAWTRTPFRRCQRPGSGRIERIPWRWR